VNIDINLSNMIYSSKCECRTSENNSSVAKTDSKSTVPTTCYLPDFFIFGKPSACISLYISSYGSVKCRPFSCQAGGRGFESLRSRSLKPRFLVERSGFFVALLYFPDMTEIDTNRPFLK